MANLIDLTGQQFGELTVLQRDNERKNGTYWICQCSCGNQISVLGKNLRKGCTKSCGCRRNQSISKKLRKDLTNQKFDRLTVIKYDEEMSALRKRAYWICQCECGTIKSINGSNLQSGKVHSCGCYNKELASQRKLIDLSGQRFGKLVVLKQDKELSKTTGNIYWICQCDCGNQKSILAASLRSKNTQSCGCLKNSIGETNIINILTKNNIEFIKEYKIKELGNLRYDFYLPDYNRLIEFDGIQHFNNNQKSKWNQNGKFEKRIINDQIKTTFALDNNYELIRIPYWEKDNITLEMIMGNQYKIKEC